MHIGYMCIWRMCIGYMHIGYTCIGYMSIGYMCMGYMQKDGSNNATYMRIGYPCEGYCVHLHAGGHCVHLHLHAAGQGSASATVSLVQRQLLCCRFSGRFNGRAGN